MRQSVGDAATDPLWRWVLCPFISKGRSSRKIQQEFEHIRKRFWGQRFWARDYFSTTSGNITDEIIISYLEHHAAKPGFSHTP